MDFLEDPEEAHVAELVGPPKVKPTAGMTIRAVEEELLQETNTVVSAALDFAKIDPESDSPPSEWVERHGLEKATERFRTAKYALMSAKDAPVGLKIATQVHGGIIKARATEKSGTRIMNVTLVEMPVSTAAYPRKEIVEKK